MNALSDTLVDANQTLVSTSNYKFVVRGRQWHRKRESVGEDNIIAAKRTALVYHQTVHSKPRL